MHGAGNDFVILNNIDGSISPASMPSLARLLCAFHTGIGADGMMVIIPAADSGDFGMIFFNSDGSIGEMCGNGARCICRYGFEHHLAGEIQHVETTAGLVTGTRINRLLYRVRLNDPAMIDLHRIVRVGTSEYDCVYLELGSPGIPHAVVLLPDWDDQDPSALKELGRELRYSSAFPKGANINFVKILGPDALKAITYERGVEDFTLACGTGCGSIAAALTLLDLVSGNNIYIHMPGGRLTVSLSCIGSQIQDIMLTGPTCVVFEGDISNDILEESCKTF